MKKTKLQKNMRVYHRYLGFFLAGIMAVYALSGILMIFRNTDFMKKEVVEQTTLPVGTKAEEIGAKLRIKNFEIESTEGTKVVFKGGTYDTESGLVTYTKKELPYLLKKMTDMHKATSDRPLFFLNIFFGLSLLFFVISSFWMFLPKTSIFKKGMYFTAAGLLLALLIIFI
jgi:hypothetical protein